MPSPGVDLYWMPVGAGTSRFQQASLAAWEAFEALRAGRQRQELFHSALKLHLGDGSTRTLELTPSFIGSPEPPLLTGPVGFGWAARFRLFRYQLRCLAVEELPDEQWAVGGAVRLAEGAEASLCILSLAPSLPPYTWGRRVPGTGEMWTSDSVVSLLLLRAGIDLSGVAPPRGGRAPGWRAGIMLAAREGASM